MQYVPKVPDPRQEEYNHNVSKRPVLLEAFYLIGGVMAIFLVVYLVLGFSMDWAVMSINEETEDRYLSALPLADKLVASDGVVHPEEKKYQQMLNQLVAVLPQDEGKYQRKYTLQLKESEEINAFAVPGGRIVILSGLLEEAHTDNEIAFVLAHELGHFKHKDHLRGLGRGIVLLALTLVTGGDSNPLTPFIASALDAKDTQFSRYQETQADDFAVQVLDKAGYDPNGGVQFMETLIEEQGNFMTNLESATEIFSTHPASQGRLEHLKKTIQQYEINH